MLKAPTGAVAVLAAIVAFAALAPRGLQAQATALQRGSDNIEVLGHLPLGPTLSVSDIDIVDLFIEAVKNKEAGHHINDPSFIQPERSMSAIGG